MMKHTAGVGDAAFPLPSKTHEEFSTKPSKVTKIATLGFHKLKYIPWWSR
jgi:hypothetical protein